MRNYADLHRNKQWQAYVVGTVTVYTKECDVSNTARGCSKGANNRGDNIRRK